MHFALHSSTGMQVKLATANVLSVPKKFCYKFQVFSSPICEAAYLRVVKLASDQKFRRLGMSVLYEYAIAAYFAYSPHFPHISAKCTYRKFFPHKLAFSTAILILFVFLLPISIRFRYLDHVVANRTAPSMCPDPHGTRWGSFKQFCTIFPPHIWCLCSPQNWHARTPERNWYQ